MRVVENDRESPQDLRPDVFFMFLLPSIKLSLASYSTLFVPVVLANNVRGSQASLAKCRRLCLEGHGSARKLHCAAARGPSWFATARRASSSTYAHEVPIFSHDGRFIGSFIRLSLVEFLSTSRAVRDAFLFPTLEAGASGSPLRKVVWAMGTRNTNWGPWDFPATPEKGMQARTRLRRCWLKRSGVNYRSAGRSKRKSRSRSNGSPTARTK
jgi:hypothetical protein